jgi:hypothetical protein
MIQQWLLPVAPWGMWFSLSVGAVMVLLALFAIKGLMSTCFDYHSVGGNVCHQACMYPMSLVWLQKGCQVQPDHVTVTVTAVHSLEANTSHCGMWQLTSTLQHCQVAARPG